MSQAAMKSSQKVAKLAKRLDAIVTMENGERFGIHCPGVSDLESAITGAIVENSTDAVREILAHERGRIIDELFNELGTLKHRHTRSKRRHGAST